MSINSVSKAVSTFTGDAITWGTNVILLKHGKRCLAMYWNASLLIGQTQYFEDKFFTSFHFTHIL